MNPNDRLHLSTQRPLGESFPKWFVVSTGVVLFVAGIAKILAALGHAKVLWFPDPIVGIQFRYLMIAVGVVELFIAYWCCFTKKRRLATYFVAWLSLMFLLYRLGLWWMKWHSPCRCLGDLTEALHISPEVADHCMKGVLAYMLLVSCALIYRDWKMKPLPTGEIRSDERTPALVPEA